MSKVDQTQPLPQEQPPLDQEQALADLDQSVADREQALADADQAAVERDQNEMDRRRAAANPADLARSVDFTRQQSELDRRQARGDARQKQAQLGGDDRQDLLDSQQHSSGEPPSSEPATPTELQADLEARGRGRRNVPPTLADELKRPWLAQNQPSGALRP